MQPEIRVIFFPIHSESTELLSVIFESASSINMNTCLMWFDVKLECSWYMKRLSFDSNALNILPAKQKNVHSFEYENKRKQ